jgi:hypothetical protein
MRISKRLRAHPLLADVLSPTAVQTSASRVRSTRAQHSGVSQPPADTRAQRQPCRLDLSIMEET